MNGRTTIQKQFRWGLRLRAGILFLLTPGIAVAQLPETRQPDVFHLEEATIEEIHHAIQDGQISCQGLVQAYVDRARAYNGACTQLVTLDGAPIAPASGPIRAGSALLDTLPGGVYTLHRGGELSSLVNLPLLAYGDLTTAESAVSPTGGAAGLVPTGGGELPLPIEW